MEFRIFYGFVFICFGFFCSVLGMYLFNRILFFLFVIFKWIWIDDFESG